MTREAMREGRISVASVSAALLSARGDLFIAASYLGCSGREIDSYIRSSEELQQFCTAIGTVKASPEYDRLSNEQFADELERLTRSYKLDAVEVIHDIAMLNAGDSAAMTEVKLKAAIALRGVPEPKKTTSDHTALLAELDAQYREQAPRIRTVRAVQIEYESGS